MKITIARLLVLFQLTFALVPRPVLADAGRIILLGVNGTAPAAAATTSSFSDQRGTVRSTTSSPRPEPSWLSSFVSAVGMASPARSLGSSSRSANGRCSRPAC